MLNCKVALVAICALSLSAAPALAAAEPAAQAPGQNKTGQNKTGGLFPPNEPMPMYRSGADNPNASLYHPGGPAPNAGNTGLSGSAGSGRGWTPPANYGAMTPAPQR